MEAKTAQVRIKRRQIIAEGAGLMRCPLHCSDPNCSHGGPVVYVTPSRAKLLVDASAVDLVGAGPSEIKPAGPLEKKDKDEKKASSPAAPAGLSTDSAPSVESGKAVSSSASEAAPASPKAKSQPSKKRGRKGGSRAS